tara:strand:+ start:325 stop:609 length:285 start_codon:yes stop_codon:yes gene_type:complete
MEIKLKDKRTLKVKNLSIDERDELLDLVWGKFKATDDGGFQMEAPNKTITKFIRVAIAGDTSDKFLKTLSFEDRTQIFTEIQKALGLGEGTPSK